MSENINNEVSKRIQKLKSKLPSEALEMIAKIIKTAVSVRIVPPTVMATAGCFVSPKAYVWRTYLQ